MKHRIVIEFDTDENSNKINSWQLCDDIEYFMGIYNNLPDFSNLSVKFYENVRKYLEKD